MRPRSPSPRETRPGLTKEGDATLEQEKNDGNSTYPHQKEETLWQRRLRMRESSRCSPIWGRSPTPPHRLEDRFEVGADDRRKKERKRKRKEERRARREAKRAKKECSTRGVGQENGTSPKDGKVQQKADEHDKAQEDSDEEEVLGPVLPSQAAKEKGKDMDYGKALRPGEGSAMAAFVADGERIPRRGEIGLTSDEISAFETQGYVMSGSRNRRMEAVRIRKENQVYSAEELAALSQYSHEERQLREQKVLNQFRMLVESKLGNVRTDDGPGSEKPDAKFDAKPVEKKLG